MGAIMRVVERETTCITTVADEKYIYKNFAVR
jgi:hypothetical protein